MRDTGQRTLGSQSRGKFAAVLGVLVAALFGVVPAKAVEMSDAVAQLYSSVSIYPPSANSMTVCYGFVCRRREILDFTTADRNALTQIMAAGRGSAAAERAAVQKVVVWFDRRMGPILGTSKRVAKADFRYFDDKHNYDCWDTTRNTTSLLLVLREWGLLKHHAIGDPHYRGNTLVLQTPHNTAVLVERATKVEWVVDLWPRGYLQPPDVMTVQKWVKED
jgi:predicted outer membrane lipoprotein